MGLYSGGYRVSEKGNYIKVFIEAQLPTGELEIQ